MAPPSSSTDLLQRTDWDLIAQQKATLVDLRASLKMFGNVDPTVLEHLAGLIHFLDRLEDHARDTLGLGQTKQVR